ncbi:Coiled-coil domain-containing protein 13, partial [Physocladia obscura]
IRSLNVLLERERNSNIELSNKLKTFQTLSEKQHEQLQLPDVTAICSNSTEAACQKIKELKEKLAQTRKKLEQERLIVQTVRVDLRNTQKALASEVFGEDDSNGGMNPVKILDFVATTVSGNNGGWKGRAQQICVLKEKIKELSATVAATRMEQKHETATGGIVEASIRENIKRIGENRQETLDKLTAEFNDISAQHMALKQRNDATVARNKNLEIQLKSHKSKIQILLEKAANDDTLIKALHSELER